MKSKTLIIVFLLGIFSFGFSSNRSEDEKIWVAVYDGSKQCENKMTEVTESEDHAKLMKADIEIFESKKIHDGQMRAAVCGNSTGAMNAFLISSSDLAQAKELGFEKK